MAQLMPLPLTVSCFSKIQIGFTFLVPTHPGSPGQRAVNGCYVHPFNGPFSGTTRVSRDQKGTTDLDFTEARDSEAIRALKPFPETVFVDDYLITMLIFYFAGFCSARDAENGVDNTVEENSSVFSLIRMHWLLSARASRL